MKQDGATPEVRPCPTRRCVFCHILEGRAPAHLLLRDDRVAAFMDIHPASRGHLLVVPVRHAETIWELSEEEAEAIFRSARRLAGAIRRALEPAGLNLLQSNGTAAGQVVPHFHLHLIPRFGADEGLHFQLRPPGYEPPGAAPLEACAARIRHALGEEPR